MPELRLFPIVPPLRCCHPDELRPGSRCGDLARWTPRSSALDVEAYYCDQHRQAGDVPIAGDVPLLRVHLQVEIYFAGVSALPAVAKAEAYDRLEREVRRMGGALGLIAAGAELGLGRIQVDARRGVERRVRGQAPPLKP